jgi:hypothetical protein
VSGIEASGHLKDPVRKPFAGQLPNHSEVYPPSPRWGALEGANIFDGTLPYWRAFRQDAEQFVRTAVHAAREEGIEDLRTWGFEACAHMSARRGDDPEAVWAALCEELLATGVRS